MTKNTFLFIVLLLPLGIFAQSSFEYGIHSYVHFADAKLIAYSDISQEAIDKIDSLETSRLSHSTGLAVRWKSDKIGFYTGLFYMNSGYRTILLDTPESDPQFENFNKYREEYIYTKLEIPAEMQFFQSIDTKNDFFFTLGLSFSLHLKDDAIRRYYAGNEPSVTEPLEVTGRNHTFLNTGFQSSLGWRHVFAEKVSLTMQPTFKLWLSPLWKNDEVTNHDYSRSLYTLGITTGIQLIRKGS